MEGLSKPRPFPPYGKARFQSLPPRHGVLLRQVLSLFAPPSQGEACQAAERVEETHHGGDPHITSPLETRDRRLTDPRLLRQASLRDAQFLSHRPQLLAGVKLEPARGQQSAGLESRLQGLLVHKRYTDEGAEKFRYFRGRSSPEGAAASASARPRRRSAQRLPSRIVSSMKEYFQPP